MVVDRRPDAPVMPFLDKIPTSLERNYVVEAVCEVRFVPANPSAAELLPGLLFGRLGKYFTSVKALPNSQLPPQIRNSNPEFGYTPLYALVGENARLNVGSRVLNLGFAKPYRGWPTIKPMILECVAALHETGMVKAVERCAMKYTNLFPKEEGKKLSDRLDVKLSVGGLAHEELGSEFQVEIKLNDSVTVVKVVSEVMISIAGKKGNERGSLVVVDTIKKMGFTDIQSFEADLDVVHTTAKTIFCSLLLPNELQSLGPRY